MGTGAYAAREKGRSPIEGIVMGLLLGPFGVLAVASLPVGRAGPPPVPRRPDREEPDTIDIARWDVRPRGPVEIRP